MASSMRLRAGAFLVGLMALTSGNAEASFITYTETIVASGSLGGKAFSGQLVTITASGDTTTVANPSGGYYTNPVGSVTVTVATVGSATFTDSIQAFDQQGAGIAGLNDLTTNSVLLADRAPAFNSYSLVGAIGPITGSTVGNANQNFGTTSGAFVFTSSSGQTTFAAVPEPSSIALTGIAGILSLVIARVRRPRS